MHWGMFDIKWLKLCTTKPQVVSGNTYGVACCVLGLCAVSLATVTSVRFSRSNERDRVTVVCRAGRRHILTGTEIFTVTLNQQSMESYYIIRSASWVAPCFLPMGFLVRCVQRHFARQSCVAMLRAVETELLLMKGGC
jgi:hypothetical protein